MILTGQSKRDFEKWYCETQCTKEIKQGARFNQLLRWLYDDGQGVVLNAFIIEWLDSVGIYIEISPAFDRSGMYNRGFEASIYQENHTSVYYISKDNDVFETRHDATDTTISKANEIYNNI